ncbi:3-deoxy-manno-octulosonate cytidylyltransferase [Sphingomonas aurantiaca]|jgi:3-deoxy-manno-octulosonate cytidylyltransferase (CMP-KDO synthetase)|uniref:3-deoxy-manno-octulosonate cytidylyltransferase n=2 Tax=Sphingomonadaceae TaxID=41297 RepID=A0A5E7YWW2_9SPHN|nr:3-deoxy-manno-octulosonate cytidylyltransferase [Sphingomonas sp. Leaf28]VVT10834.1 3-deoxy-manno-octulosonate cytidylyltransferase [Sphingomonas aurantiaca]
MKPLRTIAGLSLLHRTIGLARRAIAQLDDVALVVATDTPEIAAHARAIGCDAVMTRGAITSGSGRALAAALAARPRGRGRPGIVVNLQGDAPFQSPGSVAAVVSALSAGSADIATSVVRLDWSALDALRVHKRTAPFSGTTCVRTAAGRAMWFSKQILPAIRDEATVRSQSTALSPVWRHTGLYAYRLAALQAFEAAAPSDLERYEGLEQLRLLELGLTIDAVEIAPARFDISGIDTEADIVRAEALIAAHGDPLDDP